MNNLPLTSESVNEIAAALAKAQAVLKNPLFDSKNPFYKSNYTSLAGMIDAVRPMTEYGLSFSQIMTVIEDKFYIVTTLMHSSGQWLRSYSPIICKDASDPQKFGSAQSYAKRYALQAIVGLVGDEDDDGNAAAHPKKEDVITMQQAQELDKLIGEDKDLRASVYEWIKSEGGKSLADVKVKNFERVKKGIEIKKGESNV